MQKSELGSFNKFDAKKFRVGIAVAQFNADITKELLNSALAMLATYGVIQKNITVVAVAGSVEIPVILETMAEKEGKNKYDCLLALGAVIRGGTPHFNYVAGEAVKGISNAMMATNIPCTFGVLTVDTIEQAIERAGTKAGNKGWEAAQTAIEMVGLLKQL